jgi:hypothetical protein
MVYIIICVYVCVCFSRTLFAQYLSQKIEKEQIFEVKSGHSKNPTYLQNGERYRS